MDSLLLNAPKPFNKYPIGYRPMNGGAGLRTFGSLSSLAHLSFRPSIDSLQADSTHNIQNSYIFYNNSSCSPAVTNRSLYRSGSVDPYMEPPFSNRSLSRLNSPVKNFSDINSNRIMAPSPTRNLETDVTSANSFRKYSDALLYSQDANQQNIRQQDAFLEKLKRQKEAIENFGRPRNECGLANLHIDHSSSKKQTQVSHHNLYIQGSKVDSMCCSEICDYSEDKNSRSIPHSLHKTKSDSSIFYDVDPPFRQKLGRQLTSDSIYGSQHNNHQPGNIPNEYRLQNTRKSQNGKGSFVNCENAVDYKWPTESLLSMNAQSHIVRNSGNPEANSFICKSDSTSVIPIKLENDRILKIFNPQPSFSENKTGQFKSKSGDPLSVQTASPHSSHSLVCCDSFQALPCSHSCAAGNTTSLSQCKLRSNTIGKPLQNHLISSTLVDKPYQGSTYKAGSMYHPSPPYSPLSTSQSLYTYNSSSPLPSPFSPFHPPSPSFALPPPAPPPPFQHMRISPTRLSDERPSRRIRSQTPNRFPEIPAGLQDKLLSVTPMRDRQFSPVNKRSQSYDIEESRFSPVESKVFPGVNNKINGFHNPGLNSRYLCADSSGLSKSTIPIERSFAIVSRPSTPPATLQNSSSILQSDGSLPSLQGSDIHKHFLPSVNHAISFPVVPDSSNFGNQRLTSVLKNNCNNDCDIFDPRLVLKQDYINPQQRPSFPSHGILVKNHDGLPKPSKRVVFQCDSDVMGRLQAADYSTGLMDTPPHVRSYDNAMLDVLVKWYALSDNIGGDVADMKNKACAVFDTLRSFLVMAAGRVEPPAENVHKLVTPIVNLLTEISAFKDSKRNTPQFNHLCAVAEGIPAVGWVLVKKTPVPYIKEMLDSAMFYVNRVLKEFKEGDQNNVDWARSWKEVLETMQNFVLQTHTTGLVWNSAPGIQSTDNRPSEMAAGGPPPPPPPPPSDLLTNLTPSTVDTTNKTNREELFAQLNRGEAVTSGLKKVTDDMKTHKNPSLRGQNAPVPKTSSKSSFPSSSLTNQHLPKIELKDGKQWNVEYQVGNPNIVINIDDKKQTLYAFKCEGSVIVVKGKLNSITLDSCKKTSIVFDALVAQCETINCQSVQIQTLGEMPTLSIQKTDGCQVYLSKGAKNAEIVTSKSSEMNILIPMDDGDFVEFPVPEQFKTTFVGGKLVTQVSDIV